MTYGNAEPANIQTKRGPMLKIKREIRWINISLETIEGHDTERIKNKILTIKDFPKKGVKYNDITKLLKDPVGFKICIDDFYNRFKNEKIDVIVGIDSRGFILGGALAYLLGVGFVPVRKKGKLPDDTITVKYDMEYGSNELQIHQDAIKKGERVLIIDDQLGTGGTSLAAEKLVRSLGGKIACFAFIIDMHYLGGGKKLKSLGHKYHATLTYKE